MKIVEPGIKILSNEKREDVLKFIEKCGRVCYKSEDLITEDSAGRFVEMIVKRGHESVLEHFSFSVQFTCDRGVSHEIVRHRIASFSQESTRYVDYTKDKHGGELKFIEPEGLNDDSYFTWKKGCEDSEKRYFEMREFGATPEQARAILPTSLATTLIMTANVREWRHFLKLRTSKAAHPDIRVLAQELLSQLQDRWYELFADIELELD